MLFEELLHELLERCPDVAQKAGEKLRFTGSLVIHPPALSSQKHTDPQIAEGGRA